MRFAQPRPNVDQVPSDAMNCSLAPLNRADTQP